MKKKTWVLRLDLDEEHEFYGEVKDWIDGVCEMVYHLEKGTPFTCSLDFIYVDRGDE